MTHFAVVGGGITGLAAAWELVARGAQVTLLEASPRLGGRIVTDNVRDRPVDLGPDAFLARVPDALALCHELGLTAELVPAATDSAMLWTRGRLRSLPGGTVLGAPTSLVTTARSGVVSPPGLARAALDVVLPRRDLGADPTVGDIVTARFGREVHERLVDPLVGGIHAGPSSRLSARAVAPELATAARTRRSLLAALRDARRPGTSPPGADGSAFVSLRGGMGRLVDRLEDRLRARGVRIELGRAVDRLPVEGAAATIVTTPAPVTARLVAAASPTAADELRAIEHASVTLTVLIYAAGAVPAQDLTGVSGFLVPQRERRLMTACSFGSAKWPHWASTGEVVLRVSAGRWGDGRAMAMDDEALVARLHAELTDALGLRSPPLEARVTRWPHAFPQYRPGHLERVARIDAALARDAPAVMVAGASFRGVGIPACVAQGRAAAGAALERYGPPEGG